MPEEVEAVISSFPEVENCLVRKKSSAITGSLVEALVVYNGELPYRELAKQLRRYCFEKLERFKVPAVITVTDQISMSATGKKVRTM